MEPVRIFIGYDPREAAAFHVCVQSIIATARDPLRLQITPVMGPVRDGSNAFTYARFLVPHLCGFSGSAVFLDGDMVLRAPIEDLWDQREMGKGVQVVKHDYQTKFPVKYLGAPNQDYPCKNWSSVMLLDCGFFPNRALTPEFVSSAPGKYLHRFEWLAEHQIGELPAEWNHLTMEYEANPDAKLYHYTIGIPPFYPEQEGAAEWSAHFENAVRPANDY